MTSIGTIVCLLAARLAVLIAIGAGRGGRVGDHDSMLRQRRPWIQCAAASAAVPAACVQLPGRLSVRKDEEGKRCSVQSRLVGCCGLSAILCRPLTRNRIRWLGCGWVGYSPCTRFANAMYSGAFARRGWRFVRILGQRPESAGSGYTGACPFCVVFFVYRTPYIAQSLGARCPQVFALAGYPGSETELRRRPRVETSDGRNCRDTRLNLKPRAAASQR